MSITAKIRRDYGTVVRFARIHKVRTQSIYAVLSGRREYKKALNVLTKAGYLTADKEAA